jgi:sugar/nucleoside kinase (ribokinase family)
VSRPVLTIGEILIDLIVSDDAPSLDTANTFVARAGGAPANVAVAVARLGLPAAFCGVVGDDPFGERLRTVLARDHVDARAVRIAADFATTLAFAWKDRSGDGHFQLVRGADRLLNASDIENAGIRDAAAVVIGSVALSEEPARRALELAVEAANSANVPVCLDLNVRPSLWSGSQELDAVLAPIWAGVTLLKLSLDDARLLYGSDQDAESIFAWAQGYGIRHVVLTDGRRGCWYPDANGHPVHAPAFHVQAVEPTGAGDAFTAAIVSRLIANEWTGIGKEDAAFASAAGALTATREGAIDSLPTRAEIASFLARA